MSTIPWAWEPAINRRRTIIARVAAVGLALAMVANLPSPANAARPGGSGKGPTTSSVLRLIVTQDGIQRVTHEHLLEAGFDLSSQNLSKLALVNHGSAVRFRIGGNQRKFGPGSFVEFYGEATDTQYTRDNAYDLVVNSKLAERIPMDGAVPGTAPAAYYLATDIVDNNRAYSAGSPNGDPWYDFSMLTYSTPLTQTVPLSVDNLVSGVADLPHLTVGVWGVTDWKGILPDHHLKIGVNGYPVADEHFFGQSDHPVDVDLPEGLLVEGVNRVDLTLPGDTGYSYDMVALDRFALRYPRSFVARNGSLAFESGASSFQVTNFSGSEVIAYRLDPAGPVQLTVDLTGPNSTGTFEASFAGTGQSREYLVSEVGTLVQPAIVALRPAAELVPPVVDYLVISHPDFIAGIEPLVAYHSARGLSVHVADVFDVYDQYGGGIIDPAAIKAYIAQLEAEAGLHYVLLVGGDTYDYFDYLGTHVESQIPSPYLRTDPLVYHAPADPWYVDMDGDNVPDLALGRLPVRTTEQLSIVVQKTLTYAGISYGRTALFAADSAPGVNFTAMSDDFASRIASGWSVERAHISELGVSGARQVLLDAINRGTALVNYTGHSDTTRWTFQGLFGAADVVGLTNTGKPTVAVQLGCWNSYYVSPISQSVSQALLLGDDRGAAAVMGGTGLVTVWSDERLGQKLMPRLTTPGKSIGDALMEAKQALWDVTLKDVNLGWTLLGDPALVVSP